MSIVETKDIDVVILCGGRGTRLQSVVDDRPKPMAAIGERPFLDILIGHVAAFGFRRFILCAGYKAQSIQAYYSERKDSGLDIIILEEKELLGTGGAVKNAQTSIKSDPALILNGDSFFNMDLHKFVEFHLKKKALLSMALIDVSDANSYGSIKIDNSGKVVEFCEKKENSSAGKINAGVYLFSREVFSLLPRETKFSLEYDFFSKHAGREFYGYLAEGFFIDIGTPQRYSQAQKTLEAF